MASTPCSTARACSFRRLAEEDSGSTWRLTSLLKWLARVHLTVHNFATLQIGRYLTLLYRSHKASASCPGLLLVFRPAPLIIKKIKCFETSLALFCAVCSVCVPSSASRQPVFAVESISRATCLSDHRSLQPAALMNHKTDLLAIYLVFSEMVVLLTKPISKRCR